MKRGFTLIEVVLALGLLALLMSLVQGAYSGAARSRERSRAASRELHLAGLALDRMANEIAATFVSEQRAEATGFVLDTDSDGVSTLSFTTRLAPIPGTALGVEAELRYVVEQRDDGSLRLVREEARDLDGDLTGGGVPYTVFPEVRRFTATCYDGQEWLENWNSAERPQGEPLLPRAVAIEVAWPDPENPEDPDLEKVARTSTPLYRAEQP